MKVISVALAYLGLALALPGIIVFSLALSVTPNKKAKEKVAELLTKAIAELEAQTETLKNT